MLVTGAPFISASCWLTLMYRKSGLKKASPTESTIIECLQMGEPLAGRRVVGDISAKAGGEPQLDRRSRSFCIVQLFRRNGFTEEPALAHLAPKQEQHLCLFFCFHTLGLWFPAPGSDPGPITAETIFRLSRRSNIELTKLRSTFNSSKGRDCR